MDNLNKIKVTKIDKKKFKIDFCLFNHLISNINFSSNELMKYLYLFNSSYFEDGCLNKISKDYISIFLLIKPICKELGLSKRYIYFLLKDNINKDNNKISTTGIPIPVSDQTKINSDYIKYLEDTNILSTSLNKIQFEIEKKNNYFMNVQIIFELEPSFYMFPMMETIIKEIIKKIFKNFQTGYFNLQDNELMKYPLLNL